MQRGLTPEEAGRLDAETDTDDGEYYASYGESIDLSKLSREERERYDSSYEENYG